MSKQPPPAPTTRAVGPCPTVIQIVGRPGTGSLPSTIAPPDHPRRGKRKVSKPKTVKKKRSQKGKLKTKVKKTLGKITKIPQKHQIGGKNQIGGRKKKSQVQKKKSLVQKKNKQTSKFDVLEF